MKKIMIILCLLLLLTYSIMAQNFSIPSGAELTESTEFKSNGTIYMIERRYRLPSGETLYAYYDVEGSNSVTIQRIEQTPLLALGTDINIPGLPGYREFKFGDDKMKLVQFMKLFKLGEKDFMGRIKTPSLSDMIFNKIVASHRSDFKLILDLYDESWVLEHLESEDNRLIYSDTTAIYHTNRYAD
ncbi:MAG: hypothetical protein FWH35_00835 [Treponema sp.]|nr:hypothetical protein [Treponema sp.]